MERLDKGLIDFGILIDPNNISKYEYVRLPQKDKFGVIMRKDSPLANKKAIERKDLWNVPLIMSAQVMDDKKAVKTMLGKKSEQLNIIATYNLIYNASLLAEAGLGYVVGLDRLINTAGGSNLCFKPIEPPFEAQTYVVWKKNHVFSKAAELFMTKLTQNNVFENGTNCLGIPSGARQFASFQNCFAIFSFRLSGALARFAPFGRSTLRNSALLEFLNRSLHLSFVSEFLLQEILSLCRSFALRCFTPFGRFARQKFRSLERSR